MSAEGRQGGFSLLEVLVAVVVLGLSFVTLFELYSQGLSAAARAERYTDAMIHARSLMDGLLSEEPLEEGGDSGVLDDLYTYSTAVSRLETEEDSPREIYDIRVEVGWNGARQIRLFSRKTVPVSDEAGREP